jgi:hypothetical protein
VSQVGHSRAWGHNRNCDVAGEAYWGPGLEGVPKLGSERAEGLVKLMEAQSWA